jgi:hypothetical protein
MLVNPGRNRACADTSAEPCQCRAMSGLAICVGPGQQHHTAADMLLLREYYSVTVSQMLDTPDLSKELPRARCQPHLQCHPGGIGGF